MKKINLKVAALAIGLSSIAMATPLTSISSGNTTATVNDQNRVAGTNGAVSGLAVNPGQLFSVNAFGYEIYNVQDATHDFGYQLGSDINTFSSNYIGGTGTQTPSSDFVTTSGSSNGTLVSTSGFFTGVGNSINVAWTRTYVFVAANVLKEVYTVQNVGGSTVSNFQGFAAYDPDTYSGSSNTNSFNTVGTSNGYNYAQATFKSAGNPYLSAVLASSSPGVSIGFLPSTSLTNGNCVNALLTGSSQACNTTPGGTLSSKDQAYAYAFQIASLGVNASQSFEVYHLFGNASFNVTTALGALSGSSSGGGGVPEPGSMLLMGSACVALGIFARKRKS